MRAIAVIGANYGDEGKGLMTDFFARQHEADFIVRHNGGAQAGHTVVANGTRHVFSHFGAGSFTGAATYLAAEFISNPILFAKEIAKLTESGLRPKIFVNINSIVTTPYDMLINQAVENMRLCSDGSARRGVGRHGSCGVGINETVVRSADPRYKLTVADLVMGNWADKLNLIATEYMPSRLTQLGVPMEEYKVYREPFAHEVYHREFANGVDVFLHWISPAANNTILQGKNVIFEGAQGLALDQNNMADFPHLTRSNTGCVNVGDICRSIETKSLELVYVTRTYLTRHGAGPLPLECAREMISERIEDKTNLPHDFQGHLRFAPLDQMTLQARIERDVKTLAVDNATSVQINTAATCHDQLLGNTVTSRYNAYGPSASDVTINGPCNGLI